MTNWRQIQVRIRKARNAADAPAQLTELYEKTRDAMVAYELAVVQEKAENKELAIGWYTIAAERFRRAEWRNKAAEALRRLGAPVPEPVVAATPVGPPPEPAEQPGSGELRDEAEPRADVARRGRPGEARELPSAAEPAGRAPAQSAGAQPTGLGGKHRRRGRRGGRGRRKRGAGTPSLADHVAPTVEVGPAARPEQRPAVPQETPPASAAAVEATRTEAAPPSWQTRARAGDPAFSSRLAQLEAQLRRLVVSPLYSLDEIDQAPAGPGVFLLAEADQSAYYYVEECRTLRIAVGHLVRSERGRSGEGSIRGRMAEHLGITESKVTKYLKDHCNVRWLQLDDGASHLAHFAIAVLKPTLNE